MNSDVGSVALVPLWILREEKLPHGAVRLWALLAATGAHHRDPTRAELAAEMNLSIDTINRWMRLLQTCGCLQLIGSPNTDSERYLVTLVQRDRTVAPLTQSPLPPTRSLLPLSNGTNMQNGGGSVAPLTQLRDIEVLPSVQSTYKKLKGYPRFEQFWKKYPRKVRKSAAQQKWIRLGIEKEKHTDLWVDVMTGLRRWLEVWVQERRETKFIPHAVRWLGERCWEDEVSTDAPTPTLTKQSTTMVQASQRFLDRHPDK